LIESLIERVRSSLATVMTGVEILVDHPAMERSQRERLTLVIRDETFSLGGYMESQRADNAGDPARPWPLEEILAGDVAAAVSESAERSLDVRMSLQPPLEQIFIRADSFTLVQALVHLAASVKNAGGVLEFRIRSLRDNLRASAEVLRLKLRAERDQAVAQLMRAVVTEPRKDGRRRR